MGKPGTLVPNLGNGHGSAFVVIEAQAKYLVDAINTMGRRRVDIIECRPGVEREWNDSVQDALQTSVWNAGGCSSWYIDGNGRNSTIYPWTTVDLRRRLWRFDFKSFEQRRVLEPRAVTPAKPAQTVAAAPASVAL